jgi:predicted RNA binding protein YcfA (HicA-like mRNA interferase family)
MSPKLPVATDREIIKVARKLGFEFYRQAKGSHEIWVRHSDGSRIIVPRHAGKTIKKDIMRRILDGLGISPEEFYQLK